MSLISDAERAIESRAQQTREALSLIYRPKQQKLAANRAINPIDYEKTFALPDEHDLSILSGRRRSVDRNDWVSTFKALTYDMARTQGPLSEDYQASKSKLARHHVLYGIRPTIDPVTQEINGWTDCTELDYPLLDTSCPLPSDVASQLPEIENATGALQITEGGEEVSVVVSTAQQTTTIVGVTYERPIDDTCPSDGSESKASGEEGEDK